MTPATISSAPNAASHSLLMTGTPLLAGPRVRERCCQRRRTRATPLSLLRQPLTRGLALPEFPARTSRPRVVPRLLRLRYRGFGLGGDRRSTAGCPGFGPDPASPRSSPPPLGPRAGAAWVAWAGREP